MVKELTVERIEWQEIEEPVLRLRRELKVLRKVLSKVHSAVCAAQATSTLRGTIVKICKAVAAALFAASTSLALVGTASAADDKPLPVTTGAVFVVVGRGCANGGPRRGSAQFAPGLQGDAAAQRVEGLDVPVERRGPHVEPLGDQSHGQRFEADFVGELRSGRDDGGRNEARPRHEHPGRGRSASGRCR